MLDKELWRLGPDGAGDEGRSPALDRKKKRKNSALVRGNWSGERAKEVGVERRWTPVAWRIEERLNALAGRMNGNPLLH
ncbi:hypothetical protein TNCV_4222381 [Trichonephila clavipes]|nr:hypothetical protein TNCV_4222381 [Trichonephila clavipes]